MTLTHDSCCPLRYPEFPDPVSLYFMKMKTYRLKVGGDIATKEENLSINDIVDGGFEIDENIFGASAKSAF